MDLRVLIAAEHASAQFGGEAALPLHYFRILCQRGIPTWLVVHERTRAELERLFPQVSDRIVYVPDTIWHRLIFQAGRFLPNRLAYFTTGFMLRLMTQLMQRRIMRRIIQEQGISIIHQPMPVSPKEPSMIFGLGVPVVIGPMNGGIDYPPGFQQMQSTVMHLSLAIGRALSNLLNQLIPGKREAAMLLVANDRTRRALPQGVCKHVVELVENGVNLSIWEPNFKSQETEQDIGTGLRPDRPLEQVEQLQTAKFVYVGRLVDWKAVDLLLIAFKRVAAQLPIVELEVIGDGPERSNLEQQAAALGLTATTMPLGTKFSENSGVANSRVHFLGWLSQDKCAQRLRKADVLVLPSLLECGGAVVLEAMAMGLPVIATRWGGPTDYVDETCGILVEPSSRGGFIEGLATAITKLAISPELRQAMGQAGRRRIIEYFDWEVKVDKILDIYQQAIKNNTNATVIQSINTTGITNAIE